jgi:hypothetical protein
VGSKPTSAKIVGTFQRMLVDTSKFVGEGATEPENFGIAFHKRRKPSDIYSHLTTDLPKKRQELPIISVAMRGTQGSSNLATNIAALG